MNATIEQQDLFTPELKDIKYHAFHSKEEYLQFRKTWATFINEGKAKPTFEHKVIHFGGSIYERKYKVCNLDRHQWLLFCILTGKNLSKVFKPSDKLQENEMSGFENARFELRIIYQDAKRVVDDDFKNLSWVKKDIKEVKENNVHKFLEPFGITIERFVSIYELCIMKNPYVTNEDVEGM